MILVDTSVWIDHFRRANDDLSAALTRERVLAHPFVAGELACGNLKNRREILRHFEHLPSAPKATDEEVLAFIDARSLGGRGIGLIDVHLLAATALHGQARLWTHDRKLAEVARAMGIGFSPS